MGRGLNNTFPHEDFWGNANDTFNLIVGLQSPKFKVIVHKKAYDLQTLVGNCGGYIGLILGKFSKSLYPLSSFSIKNLIVDKQLLDCNQYIFYNISFIQVGQLWACLSCSELLMLNSKITSARKTNNTKTKFLWNIKDMTAITEIVTKLYKDPCTVMHINAIARQFIYD